MNAKDSDQRNDSKRRGGLYGKARKNRVRNRAWRLHSQQLIEDFVEPSDASPTNRRAVPVKHKAEFNPSAPVLGGAYGVGTERELKLVYATGEQNHETDQGFFEQAYALVGSDSKEESAIRFTGSEGACQESDSGTGVQPSERNALLENSRTKSSPTSLGQVEVFTAGGFMFGCALGTAAAAVLLMMMRVVLL